MIAVIGYLATYIESDVVPSWARYMLWPLYWFMQGTVMTGVWVLAHECGHQAFSPSKTVNNTVGWVLHSALLVPYHSWRISHGNHHKNTCSVENDEVFVAPTRSQAGEMINESPILQAVLLVNMLLLGWPGYLIANMSGPTKYSHSWNNSHFSPTSVLFKVRQQMDVVISDIGFFAAVGAIIYASNVFGWSTVAKYYFIPYLVVNAYLVLITYLQHTDIFVPHFAGKEFTWLRGALATVDRSFGVINHFIHHITDTHVAHHLFHTMPFYHAEEATEAIKSVLGPYYLEDKTPIWKALWYSWKYCKFVEDGEGVHFYKRRLTE
jgi:omega-6 fatty acid desaturase (delta-12 desaturase)